MFKKKFSKVFGLISLAIIMLLFVYKLPMLAEANKLLETRDSLKFDYTLRGNLTYEHPKPVEKIVVVPITTQDQLLQENFKQWIDLLYYFSITRYKLPDIPFNYIIDPNGTLYDFTTIGLSGAKDYYYIETKNGEAVIAIGVLITNNKLSQVSGTALSNLISQLSYQWGVKKDFCYPASMSYETTKTLSKLQFTKKTQSDLDKEILHYIDQATFSNTRHIDYNLKILDVTYPEQLKGGTVGKVSFKIQNLSEYPFFINKEYLYVSSASKGHSVFAVNGVWDSFTKPTHLEKTLIKSGGVLPVEFQIRAPFIPGDYSEVFYLVWENGEKIDGTEFTVKIKIEKSEEKLVKIKKTETGYLNVRDCPRVTCKKVGEVASGSILKLLKQKDNWYQIQYQEEKSGWVYGKYVSKL